MEEIMTGSLNDKSSIDKGSIIKDLIKTLEGILKMDSIKSGDNIFVLGASSLQAINFAAEISGRYGIAFKTSNLFKLKSIEEIADYILQSQMGDSMIF